MMDIREKLVELLNEIIDGGFKWHNYLYESGEQLNNDDIASSLIANGVTVQKWISVKDRLPEYSNDEFADAVLVTDGFLQHMAYFVGGEWRFAESGEIKEPMWYRITHWMPLPLEPEAKK